MRGQVTRRRLVAALGSSLLLAACSSPMRQEAAATQDEAEIERKTLNPPAAALEPDESSFPIPNPIFIPPQTLVRRWRINTVERDVSIDLGSWRLRIGGLVEQPFELTYQEMLALPRMRQTTDLHCVEGWGFYDIRWEGTHLSSLFDRAGARPDATHVAFFTHPNVYSDSLTIEQALAAETMLADRANDEPLAPDHGFPLRLVVPSMYGYKSVKWVDRIDLVRGRHIGYWEKRGWRPDPWIG
jgi:DMSO/TMAO reductase YedYZ molybdopterin-dependent catalytic subunit